VGGSAIIRCYPGQTCPAAHDAGRSEADIVTEADSMERVAAGTTTYREQFEEQGFVVLKQFFGPDELEQLRAAINDAERKIEGGNSLDKGGLQFRMNLFRQSEAVQQFIAQPKIVDFLREIIGPDIWCRWDQAVDKTPGAPEFPWHQDNGYNGLSDGHFQLWIALTEMTVDNGGLWVQRGSHKNGYLPHEQVENHVVSPGNEADAVFIGADAGDVVLFSSFMLHRTAPNTTDKSRTAYVVEYMSMKHFDPFIHAPYFVVARDGKSAPHFVHFFKGRFNPRTQAKYLKPRFEKNLKPRIERQVKRLLRSGS
jgi:ectoine hydroxylase-related dioxygenase (phytanoyl-CoA dioxygenase family)